MDEIQAAVLVDKLRNFNYLQSKRKKIAKFYLNNIKIIKFYYQKLIKILIMDGIFLS